MAGFGSGKFEGRKEVRIQTIEAKVATWNTDATDIIWKKME